MSRRAPSRIAACAFVVLALLHLDFWRPQRAELLFGWLPEELAYRLAYCALAWSFMLFVCSKVWREEPDP
jgi:hypothetical protein